MTRAVNALCVAAVVSCMSCGGAKGGDSDSADLSKDPCEGISAPAHEVWNDKVKDGLDFSVRIYEGEIRASDAESAVEWMAAFTRSWTKAKEDLCRDHQLGAVPAQEFTRMDSCLDAALEQQRRVVEELAHEGAPAIDRALALVDEIKACVPEAEIFAPVVPEDTVYKENPFVK